MPAKYTQQTFIEEAIKIHNNYYNYSNIFYKNLSSKVTIICPKHGEFKQNAFNHLNGSGCKECGIIKCQIKDRTKDTIWFIKQAKIKNNNKYNYSKTQYNGAFNKVIIICSEHGEFEIDAFKHICKRAQGCTKCNGTYRRSVKEFIEEAIKIHNNYFDYSKTNFKNTNSKVTIICPKHGEFKQIASNHLAGNGCKKCMESKGEREVAIWLDKKNILYNREYSFQDCKGKKGRLLRFDFFLYDYNICIEYDGKQHFEEIKHWGSKSFTITIENDKIKNNYCNKNNIHLIRIKYNENVTDILQSQLKIN